MTELESKIEILQDENGLAIFGDPQLQSEFLSELQKLGISDKGNALELSRLEQFLGKASSVLENLSNVAADSGRYLKLTPESAEKLQKIGLIPVKGGGSGISHAVLGKSGDIKGWLQVESGLGSLFSNPAALAGVSGILAEQALISEIKKISEMLDKLDNKIDSIRNDLRIKSKASLNRASDAIADAQVKITYNDGQLNSTTWSIVRDTLSDIDKVRNEAVEQLGQMSESAQDAIRAGDIKKLGRQMQTLEEDVVRWLSLLARSLQLREEFAVLELLNVARENPEQLKSHSAAVTERVKFHRLQSLALVRETVSGLSKFSEYALERVILHPTIANRTTGAMNFVFDKAQVFESAFGLIEEQSKIESMPWFKALRLKPQRRVAVNEAKPALLAVALTVTGLVVAWAKKNRGK